MAELKLLLFTVPVGFNTFFIRVISAGWIFHHCAFSRCSLSRRDREASTFDYNICMRHGEREKRVEIWVNLSVA